MKVRSWKKKYFLGYSYDFMQLWRQLEAIFAVTLGSLLACEGDFGDTSGSICGSHWGHSGVTLRLLCGYFGIILPTWGSLWDHLGSLLDVFGITLDYFSHMAGTLGNLGVALRWLWDTFRMTLR